MPSRDGGVATVEGGDQPCPSEPRIRPFPDRHRAGGWLLTIGAPTPILSPRVAPGATGSLPVRVERGRIAFEAANATQTRREAPRGTVGAGFIPARGCSLAPVCGRG